MDESVPHKAPQTAHFGDLDVVQAFLKIETRNGRREGPDRLASDADDGGRWKTFTLLTALKELTRDARKIFALEDQQDLMGR